MASHSSEGTESFFRRSVLEAIYQFLAIMMDNLRETCDYGHLLAFFWGSATNCVETGMDSGSASQLLCSEATVERWEVVGPQPSCLSAHKSASENTLKCHDGAEYTKSVGKPVPLSSFLGAEGSDKALSGP